MSTNAASPNHSLILKLCLLFISKNYGNKVASNIEHNLLQGVLLSSVRDFKERNLSKRCSRPPVSVGTVPLIAAGPKKKKKQPHTVSHISHYMIFTSHFWLKTSTDDEKQVSLKGSSSLLVI